MQILKTVQPMLFVRFYVIWITITVAAVIYVVSVVGHAPTPKVRQAEDEPIPHTRTSRSVWHSQVTALSLLSLFLMCYIALLLTWENFAYYDNSIFTSGTLMGRDIVPMISGGAGRFFPLADQEFNLIRHFTHTNIGYHILPIAQLLILSYILLILDSELVIAARVALAMLALLTPSDLG